MKKYIINGKTYTCTTKQPHGWLKDLLIDAQLDGLEIIEVDEEI